MLTSHLIMRRGDGEFRRKPLTLSATISSTFLKRKAKLKSTKQEYIKDYKLLDKKTDTMEFI